MTAGAPTAEELDALRRDYLAEIDEQLAVIRRHGEALRSRRTFETSYPVLLYLSHQIKGSGATIGFPEVSEGGRKLAESLGAFLGEGEARPTPEALAERVVAIAGELARAVAAARERLGS